MRLNCRWAAPGAVSGRLSRPGPIRGLPWIRMFGPDMRRRIFCSAPRAPGPEPCAPRMAVRADVDAIGKTMPIIPAFMTTSTPVHSENRSVSIRYELGHSWARGTDASAREERRDTRNIAEGKGRMQAVRPGAGPRNAWRDYLLLRSWLAYTRTALSSGDFGRSAQ